MKVALFRPALWTEVTSWAALMASLPERNFIVIPELENGVPTLSRADRSTLSEWVAGGGQIVFGGDTDVPTILNSIFGWTVNTASCGIGKSQRVIDSSFMGWRATTALPAELPDASAVRCIGRLPTSRNTVYGFSGSSAASVAYFSVGSGSVVYLGFDFYTADVTAWESLLTTITASVEPGPGSGSADTGRSVLYDPAYVDVDGEGDRTVSALSEPLTWTKLKWAAIWSLLPSQRQLLIPELRIPPPVESQRRAIQQWLMAGGELIITAPSSDFVTALSGITVSTENCLGPSTYRPNSVLNVTQYLAPYLLPARSRCLERATNWGDLEAVYMDSYGNVAIGALQVGAGRVIFLADGWSKYDAAWIRVLQVLTMQSSKQHTTGE